MPLIKPVRGIQLNRSHPLARGLVGCWLFNEGTGGKVFDLTDYGNHGTLQANTSWGTGKFGVALEFNGMGDYVNCGNDASLRPANITVAFWFYNIDDAGSWDGVIKSSEGNGYYDGWRFIHRKDSASLKITFQMNFGEIDPQALHTGTLSENQWHHIVGTYNGTTMLLYANGMQVANATNSSGINYADTTSLFIGYAQNYFNGTIDGVKIFNRALTAAEIAHFYREPFCMFDRAISPLALFVPIINLAGTASAQSATSATAKLIRRISGSAAAVSATSAILKITGEVLLAGSIDASAVPSGKLTLRYRGSWLSSPLKIERQWLTDALFNGMTSNAFKLGTVPTCGWFWMRPSGCTALYGGPSMEQIDFANILEVVEQDADSVSLPNYIPHKIDSTYFYVVRKFNICGYQEHSLQAAVKLAIDAEGNLTEPQPNHIFACRADHIQGNKVQLLWFYCPLEQKSETMRFNVYYDRSTGQINYKNPIAEINYRGRQFYRWQSDALTTGKYLFAIRAKDADGVECNSLAQLAIEIEDVRPDEIEVFKVETT